MFFLWLVFISNLNSQTTWLVTPYCVFAELVSETVCLRSDSCWLEILY